MQWDKGFTTAVSFHEQSKHSDQTLTLQVRLSSSLPPQKTELLTVSRRPRIVRIIFSHRESHRTNVRLVCASWSLSRASLTRRAQLWCHQRIIYPSQPTSSALFAPAGRFSIGHSIHATETDDCEPTWANTHSPGKSDAARHGVASSQSALVCELLTRRARSTDARLP